MTANAEAPSVPKMHAEAIARASLPLSAGQIIASREASSVTTILGSCVSVCLWDPSTRIGGINHFLLPDKVGGDRFSARFGTVACRELLGRILALGALRSRVEAKVFGGACVLDAFRNGNHLGARNVETALGVLAEERIPVVASDVGGRCGRRLVYFTDTGDAWVKTIHRGAHGP